MWLSDSRRESKKDKVKAVIMRKEVAWREMLGARDEAAKERCLEVYKKEKRKVKRLIYSQQGGGTGTVWKDDDSRCK